MSCVQLISIYKKNKEPTCMTTKLCVKVLLAGLTKEFPKLSETDAIQILYYLKRSKRPRGFKCAVMSQHYVLKFDKLYHFSRAYL